VEKTRYPVTLDGKKFTPNRGVWKTGKEGMDRLITAGRVSAGKTTIGYVRFLDDFPAMQISNLWNDTAISGASDKTYVVQTIEKVVERCLLMTTDPGDLVLDPTCGSGTTAYVAEQWGRRWITCDTSRVALALARTRLMAAKFPYYHLADDYPNWTQHIDDKELKDYLKSTAPASDPRHGPDVRKGFVYKRVPHVTLASIANNIDIKPGMTREQIDSAINRNADPVTLFDLPYPDPKRLRVSGPFTVESL